jgi:hypothetical protein
VARVAGTVGRAVDPINASLKVAGAVGKGVGHVGAAIGGVTTGVGGQALRTAARAGFEGGEAGAAFRDSMRGNVPMEDVITDAKTALGNIKQARSAAYNAGMTGVSADTKVLDFSKIDEALAKTKAVKTFKGVSLSPSTDATVQELAKVVDEWRGFDPTEFHTASGFDALKQRIGDIRDEAAYGTPQRLVADQVYNAVKNEVVKQAPEYARTMADYEKASNLIREMEKTLSLNPKASVDTTLRKLQSVMRDNVNTNYGKRADLVQLLQDSGAKNLLNKLAGQSLKSFEPRGLARVTAGLGTIATGAGAAFLNPMSLLPVAGALATQSPRLVGELTHLSGRGANALSRVPLRNALMAAYQTRGTSNAFMGY